MTRNDNEWNKECKYNKEHLPTHAILIGSKSCVPRLIPVQNTNTHILRTSVMYGANNVKLGISTILEGKMVSQTNVTFQHTEWVKRIVSMIFPENHIKQILI